MDTLQAIANVVFLLAFTTLSIGVLLGGAAKFATAMRQKRIDEGE